MGRIRSSRSTWTATSQLSSGIKEDVRCLTYSGFIRSGVILNLFVYMLSVLGNASLKKECFLSGIARMRGVGEDPARIKKNYIYSFLTAEKDVQVARNGGRGGGEEIWAMPERKHSFFKEVFP